MSRQMITNRPRQTLRRSGNRERTYETLIGDNAFYNLLLHAVKSRTLIPFLIRYPSTHRGDLTYFLPYRILTQKVRHTIWFLPLTRALCGRERLRGGFLTFLLEEHADKKKRILFCMWKIKLVAYQEALLSKWQITRSQSPLAVPQLVFRLAKYVEG